jgi:hypothetical protein
MTKIWAILSDVHGRGDRLKRVLADAEDRGASRVLALGDIGDVPALNTLWPPVFRADGLWAAHASPVWPEGLGIAGVVDYLRERQQHWTVLFPSLQRSEQARWDALAELETADVRIFLHGHTHTQEAWRWIPGGVPQHIVGEHLKVEAGERWLVGVGSVGTPHDSDAACYALYDEAARQVTWRRV